MTVDKLWIVVLGVVTGVTAILTFYEKFNNNIIKKKKEKEQEENKKEKEELDRKLDEIKNLIERNKKETDEKIDEINDKQNLITKGIYHITFGICEQSDTGKINGTVHRFKDELEQFLLNNK